MVYLKYYAKENEEFSRYRGFYIDKNKIREICDNVCKHFNLNNLYLVYSSKMRHEGMYYESHGMIKFRLWGGKAVNLLAILHELAHHLDSTRNGKYNAKYWNVNKNRYCWKMLRKSHTKLHRQCLIDIINYYEYLINKNKYENAPVITVSGVIQ